MKRQRAFTLIEFTVALLLTIILAGGFTLALNSITQGTRNATRSTDLTNLSRGVFKIMQSDIYNANKAFSDLNLYQIHVNASNGDTMFYGIRDLSQTSGAGTSSLELQWFENHRNWVEPTSGVSYNLPTNLSNSTWQLQDPATEPGDDISVGVVWPDTIPNLTLMSTVDPDPDLANIGAGDYFILFRADLFYDTASYDLNNLMTNIDPATGLWDETVLKNGAMLLQVADVQNAAIPPTYDGTPGFGFLSAVDVSFGGTTFLAGMGSAKPETNYTEPVKIERPIGDYFKKNAKRLKQFRPPEGAWMARKVGESRNDNESYRQVHYWIDSSTNTLIRTQNGQDMILASNVDYFDIQIGLDVTDLTESWDGAVKLEDPSYWISDFSDLAFAPDIAKAIVGRHALAVKIVVSFRSLMADVTDKDAAATSDAYKKRTFEQVIRLKNGHLPMGSL